MVPNFWSCPKLLIHKPALMKELIDSLHSRSSGQAPIKFLQQYPLTNHKKSLCTFIDMSQALVHNLCCLLVVKAGKDQHQQQRKRRKRPASA